MSAKGTRTRYYDSSNTRPNPSGSLQQSQRQTRPRTAGGNRLQTDTNFAPNNISGHAASSSTVMTGAHDPFRGSNTKHSKAPVRGELVENPGVIHRKQESVSVWSNWKFCKLCSMSFKNPGGYIEHLREFHCTKGGGQYVCRYGDNGICTSSPIEGVSDKDYELHVARDHAVLNRGKFNWLILTC